MSATRSKHGHTVGRKRSGEYTSWILMRSRCLNPNATNYADYGGKGVKVCESWKNSFASFLSDMGPKPTPKHSLDRINPFGNYEPGNCRWATAVEQQSNKRRPLRDPKPVKRKENAVWMAYVSQEERAEVEAIDAEIARLTLRRMTITNRGRSRAYLERIKGKQLAEAA